MRRIVQFLAASIVAGLSGTLMYLPSSHAGDIGYVEDFALARDRAAVLKQLIPGTDDFYYYHGLHYLNTEQYEQAAEILKAWYDRHKSEPPRWRELKNRLVLVTFDKNPAAAFDYLRNHLQLNFNHQRDALGTVPNFPTQLDPAIISREKLKAKSAETHGPYRLSGYEDSALDWLAEDPLTWEQRRELLGRLKRSDIPNLPKLVADDLASPHSGEFGSLAAHRIMTINQLDELLKLVPGVLNQTLFVQTYISKLHPGADDDWKLNKNSAQAYLDRLQAFVDRLQPVHNTLKAHVLYHRLALDRTRGIYDRERFMKYIQLPRGQAYMSRTMLESEESQRHPANLLADFGPVTLMPTVGNDEPLVRSYLAHFFIELNHFKDFEPFINDGYLRQLFAETKLVHGLGNPELWAANLTAEALRALKDRVDIDFADTNRNVFGIDDPIRIELFVKNTPQLIVKVFELNTENYYKTHQKEIDTDINLDGLVPNAERVIPMDHDPFRRVPLTLEFPDARNGPNFPEKNRPGVYVIDLIGGGKSSRALIRKGRLLPLVSPGSAGSVVRVVDERNLPVPDAVLWLGGQEYKAGPDGRIILPFSTQPGRKKVVLSREGFACLHELDHAPESIALQAGIHIDRESLISQQIAPVFIRPSVRINGFPVSVKSLTDVRLRITSVDFDGVPTSLELPNFPVFEDRESMHDIRVPARIARISVTLLAKMESLSTGRVQELQVSRTFTLNGFARTERLEDAHFARFSDDYIVELLGRTGEAKADKPLHFQFKHRDFRDPVPVTLKTDASGRVSLGPLAEIVSVQVQLPDNTTRKWNTLTDAHTYRQVMHAKAGDTITVPYLGRSAQPLREELALFEVVGSNIRADHFRKIQIADGKITIRGLAAGDYDLWLKRTGTVIRIRVAEAVMQSGYLLGKTRFLQAPAIPPLQIESIRVEGDNLVVKLQDASPYARVHIFGMRYLPEFSAFHNLGAIRDVELQGYAPGQALSVFLTGRNIGDEYRYVLERRNQRKYPGNMLERPMLLLNPWAVRNTETSEQLAREGDRFGGTGGGIHPGQSVPKTESAPAVPSPEPLPGELSEEIDYLAEPSAIAINQLADKDGFIRLPRKNFGSHGIIQVVAVDPLSTTSRVAFLPEEKASFLDLRMRKGLDPNRHFTQQKQVTIVEAGKPIIIHDFVNSRFEMYDSLARVYSLYSTLSNNPHLAEFSFILQWPKLKPEEKRKKYSESACHELNFFLAKKDPEFFQEVVKPHLAQKKDKTFLDHWLLGSGLRNYLEPWEFGRLNVPERILLAQRIAGEPGKTARHLSELLKLIPPNPNQELYWFDVAVSASALDQSRNEMMDALKTLGMPQKHDDVNNELALEQGSKPSGNIGVPMPPGGYAGKKDGEAKNGFSPRGDGKGEPGTSAPRDDAGRNNNRNKEMEFYQEDRRENKPRALYRKLDPTQEWAENHYYKLLITQQLADLVSVNPFWADYAKYSGQGGFLSRHIPAASRNFTEMMLALSVLDLPFEPGKHVTKFDDGRMTMTPGSQAIAFHEEVRPAEGAGGQIPILVSQNFYRSGDRYREENGERQDKFITDEFIVHTAYGCQIVITNPTSSRQKLQVLIQLPNGAMPLGGGRHTRSVSIDLEPYHTRTIDYSFYFPMPGQFTQFPVHVARNEQFVVAAKPQTFNVLAKPTKLDTSSWDYVSQYGTNEDILAFLQRENVHGLNLERIAFRMKDRPFFDLVIKLLTERHRYQHTLWSYGLFHQDLATTREFLKHQDSFVAECGGPIKSTLLTIDPVHRRTYEHLEYKPLVNARVHALGQRRQIVNDRLYEQYHRLLHLLKYQPQLDDSDLLATTYYLLLQDRIEEALSAFQRVHRDRVPTRMQYDYCAAYLEMFQDDPRRARSIAETYKNYPVDRWRNTFAALIAQLDEIEGKAGQVVDAADRTQQQGQLAATEPGFEFSLEGAKLKLTWQNLDAVMIHYYPMDVELMFSSNPFVTQGNSPFASIRPNLAQKKELPKDRKSEVFTIPPEFASRNMLVEIHAAGKSRILPYYASAMTVAFTENYGQLRVSDNTTGKGLGKVYVKVYARLSDGSVKFHKDGYTDLRGRFDYASVNTPERRAIERFAVLVLSEDKGAMFRETAPPPR